MNLENIKPSLKDILEICNSALQWTNLEESRERVSENKKKEDKEKEDKKKEDKKKEDKEKEDKEKERKKKESKKKDDKKKEGKEKEDKEKERKKKESKKKEDKKKESKKKESKKKEDKKSENIKFGQVSLDEDSEEDLDYEEDIEEMSEEMSEEDSEEMREEKEYEDEKVNPNKDTMVGYFDIDTSSLSETFSENYNLTLENSNYESLLKQMGKMKVNCYSDILNFIFPESDKKRPPINYLDIKKDPKIGKTKIGKYKNIETDDEFKSLIESLGYILRDFIFDIALNLNTILKLVEMLFIEKDGKYPYLTRYSFSIISALIGEMAKQYAIKIQSIKPVIIINKKKEKQLVYRNKKLKIISKPDDDAVLVNFKELLKDKNDKKEETNVTKFMNMLVETKEKSYIINFMMILSHQYKHKINIEELIKDHVNTYRTEDSMKIKENRVSGTLYNIGKQIHNYSEANEVTEFKVMLQKKFEKTINKHSSEIIYPDLKKILMPVDRHFFYFSEQDDMSIIDDDDDDDNGFDVGENDDIVDIEEENDDEEENDEENDDEEENDEENDDDEENDSMEDTMVTKEEKLEKEKLEKEREKIVERQIVKKKVTAKRVDHIPN
jgi:hypothetical protein